jgi:hypothetical protein
MSTQIYPQVDESGQTGGIAVNSSYPEGFPPSLPDGAYTPILVLELWLSLDIRCQPRGRPSGSPVAYGGKPSCRAGSPVEPVRLGESKQYQSLLKYCCQILTCVQRRIYEYFV